MKNYTRSSDLHINEKTEYTERYTLGYYSTGVKIYFPSREYTDPLNCRLKR